MIVWEFAWTASALVILDERSSYRGCRLNRFDRNCHFFWRVNFRIVAYLLKYSVLGSALTKNVLTYLLPVLDLVLLSLNLNLDILNIKFRHWNTGLMFSGISLTSWGEGASLALVRHSSNDGVTIKTPCGRCFITSTSLAPHLFLLDWLKLNLMLLLD